jgi:hypothetical protein
VKVQVWHDGRAWLALDEDGTLHRGLAVRLHRACGETRARAPHDDPRLPDSFLEITSGEVQIARTTVTVDAG